jgi:hypothetical protein
MADPVQWYIIIGNKISRYRTPRVWGGEDPRPYFLDILGLAPNIRGQNAEPNSSNETYSTPELIGDHLMCSDKMGETLWRITPLKALLST